MNYYFSDTLLLRMPAVAEEAYHNTSLQQMLEDPLFRAALYIASPAFWDNLNRSGFDATKLKEKECLTILKYFNRFCFRTTPFGLFSSVSLIRWTGETSLRFNRFKDFSVALSPDQAYAARVGPALLAGVREQENLFVANPTIYRAMEEYRFIRTTPDQDFIQREYQLQSTDFSRLLKDILAFCRAEKTNSSIVTMIRDNAGCSVEEATDYVGFLKDSQLLLPVLRPNIAGSDYLQNLLAGQETSGDRPAYPSVLTGRIKITGNLRDVSDKRFRGMNQELAAFLPENAGPETRQHLNVILTRPMEEGGLTKDFQEKIADGLFALNALCPAEKLPEMERFIKGFQQHFEGRSVPLMTALDPELGIGYQHQEPETDNPLLETLHVHLKSDTGQLIAWSPAHEYLLDRWHSGQTGKQTVIELEEDELRRIGGISTGSQPLGLSVLFRISEKMLYLESAGGVNAPALAGRFTTADAGIHRAARAMAAEQEAANPHILFAEILHLSNPHTDNVNRRENIWSWDLPLTAASTQAPERQLPLSDIMVAVENNKVVLRSASGGKVIMPRLTSAYNHALNRLPLFRFLADIPYQFGRSDLSVDLQRFFPGLSFYPAVKYKGTLLFPATWIISGPDLAKIQNVVKAELYDRFEAMRLKTGLPDIFALTEGDQQLLIHTRKREDVDLFLGSIRQKEKLIIKDYFTGRGPAVDAEGYGYTSQFNAFVLPAERLNLPELKKGTGKVLKQTRKYIPGSEWLYLKIYSPRISASRLLLKILPLLRKRYTHGPVRKWFFIRYEDHAPHIRLRMQIDPLNINELLFAFKTQLEDSIHHHVLREYQIDVYTRELERYSAGGIENTETHFWASSELVAGFLKKQARQPALSSYLLGLVSVMDLVSYFVSGAEAQAYFCHSSYQGLSAEFTGDNIRVELDRKYRELGPAIHSAFSGREFYSGAGIRAAARQFVKSLSPLLQTLTGGVTQQADFLRSIIHMHVNRLFPNNQRKQEMVIYYLLYKYLRSELKRKRS
ncbi:lantibiotic dehydratase [Mucilaginibacter celer]|uniref:Thiopeptide-type bacteriocin biosynthesis protein n=1 Tax=Mucilaginibacter celer TaxID=2305508 RepID=A0A494VHV7_9SPHI|nr:lantibiotic dehydratase [Mucilaginibacter celer]AYL94366.1 hypothetical protein HYN43_003215 [Mucilaginibacter celer]